MYRKHRIKSLISVLIIAALCIGILSKDTVVFPSRTAFAEGTGGQKTVTFKFDGFDGSNTNVLQLNGNATVTGSAIQAEVAKVLRVCPSALGLSGSVFNKNVVALSNQYSFSTYFEFSMNTPGMTSGADGFVFTIQTQSSNVGSTGSGLGYQGIDKSLGIEFDTYNNGDVGYDSDDNHIAIDLNGSLDHQSDSRYIGNPGGFDLNDGTNYHVWVDYNGAACTIEVRISKSNVRPAAAVLSATVDLSGILKQNEVYAGFTSSTGGSWQNHDILRWYFNNDYNPIDTSLYSYVEAPTNLELSAVVQTVSPSAITAYVTNADGSNASGITVDFTSDNADAGTLSSSSAVTDNNGNATITINNSGSTSGTTNIKAVAQGGACDTIAVTIGPTITAEPQPSGNYIRLDWNPNDTSQSYHYMVTKKDLSEANSTAQTIPLKSTARVLNVFPTPESSGSETFINWKNEICTISTSARVKRWMEEANSENSEGYGKGLISVDTVYIDDFSSNPDYYLKDENNKYKYDVIFTGAWDSNNHKDISLGAMAALQNFIDFGGGYLAGHDTTDIASNTNLSALGAANINMTAQKLDYFYGGTELTCVKTGQLTNYPWSLSSKTLNVPMSHTTNQFAKGYIWMKYTSDTYNTPSKAEITSLDGATGTNNFYLTSWNNTAMIQTGHSNGSATADEQKILANTLLFLSQISYGTSFDDHSAQDLTAPGKVSNVNFTMDIAKKANITFDDATDDGNTYEYQLKAYGEDNKAVYKSSPIQSKITSGIRGYAVIVDDYPDSEPGNIPNTYTNSFVSDELSNGQHYIHIKAIDCAGNEGATVHIPITVTGNTAPVLDNSTDAVLPPINEDVSDSSGILVSDLLAGKTSDADGNTVGIAVTLLDNSNGSWDYQADGGAWLQMPMNGSTLSESNAQLLLPTARIRFRPASNYNGTASMNFRAWDQTAGTATTAYVDNFYNIEANGGSTAFSKNIGTASITVNAVNDAPVLEKTTNGKILQFNGSNGTYMSVPDMHLDGSFTVSAWIKAESADDYARVFEFGNGEYDNNLWMGFNGTTGKFEFETFKGDTRSNSLITTDIFPLNTWVYVTAVYDQAGKMGYLYYNGEVKVSGTMDLTHDGTITRAYNYFGKSNFSKDAYFKGSMYAMSVWNVARNQNQIKSDMNNTLTGTEDGLAAFYPLLEGNGTMTADATGKSHDGTLYGVTWNDNEDFVYSASGYFNNEINLNEIKLYDTDALDGDMSLTLSAQNGMITFGSTDGLTFDSDGLNGTKKVTAKGTLEKLNQDLTTLTYTPDADYLGTDTISVILSDQGNTGNETPVILTDTGAISINVLPLTDSGLSSLNVSNPLTGNLELTPGFSSGIYNYSAAVPYKVSAINVNAGMDVTRHQTASINGVPGASKEVNLSVGSNTVTVEITAQDGITKSVYYINIERKQNIKPVAIDGSLTTNEDTPGSGSLSASDEDIYDTLTYNIVTSPSHGTVDADGHGSYTYTPAANYAGTDSFTFKVNDGTDDSNTAAVSISVKDCTGPVITLNGDQTVHVNLGSNYTDAGAAAYDAYDKKDITVTCDATAVNTKKSGTYEITYSAEDSTGNIAAIKRTVIVAASFTNDISVSMKTQDGTAYSGNWTDKDVIITISGGINADALAKYQWSNDNSVWNDMTGAGSNTLTVSENKAAKYYFRAYTIDGISGSPTGEYPVKIDKETPTVHVTGDTASWTNKDITLSVAASSGISGIASVTVSKDGVAAVDITGKDTYNAAANGSYRFVITSNAGQTSDQTILVSGIDKTAPAVHIESIKSGASDYVYSTAVPSENEVVITLVNPSGNISGVTYYSSTDGTNWTAVAGNTLTVTDTHNTSVNYLFKAVSGSGTESTAPVTVPVYIVKSTFNNNITVDAKTPDGKAYTGTWTKEDITLTLSGGINEEAFLKYQYSTDQTNWSDMESSDHNQLILSEGQNRLYYFRVVSKGLSTGSVTGGTAIEIDKAIPADIKIYTKSPEEDFVERELNNSVIKVFYKDRIEVKIASSDNSSGLKQIWYQADGKEPYVINDADWVKTDSSNEITFNLDKDFKGIIYAAAVDNAGNISDSVSLPVVIEGNQPALSVTPDNAESWSSTGVTFTVNAADEGVASGISEISWVTDKGESAVIPADADADFDRTNDKIEGKTFTVNENGSYTVTITARDNAGNTTIITRTVKIDKVAPNIHIVPEPGFVSGTWYNHDIVFNFSKTTENQSDVKYQYSTDGVHWTYTSKAASQTFSGDTNAVYKFRSINASGIAGEPSNGYEVKIKVTAPALPAVGEPDEIWYSEDQYLPVIPPVDTEHVGIKAQYRIKTDGGSFSEWTDTEDGKVPVTQNGINAIEIRTVNMFGNTQGVIQRTIKLDKTAPAEIKVFTRHTDGSFTERISDNSDFKVFYNNQAEVKITAVDSVSGIKQIWYQKDGTYPYAINNSGWVKTDASDGITFKLDADFKGVIYFTAIDQAGNIAGTSSLPVVVEDNPPILTVTPDSAGKWSGTGVTFTVSADETGEASGISEVSYVTDKGESGTLTADADADNDKTNDRITARTFTVNENGEYQMTITAKDYSGNITAMTRTVKIDKVMPDITVAPPAGFVSGTWYDHELIFNFTKTTDNKSEVKYQYSIDGIHWTDTNGSDSQTFKEDTNAVCKFRSINSSGIASEPTEGFLVKIKITAPVLPDVEMPVAGWYMKEKNLIVSAPEDTEGVGVKVQYHIRMDGGDYSEWSDVKNGNIPVNGNGYNYIEVRAVNKFGNTKGVVKRTVKIDRMIPQINISGIPEISVNHDITLNINTAAGPSGIKSITVNGMTITDNTYTIKENGTYEFVITSIAGLSGSQTVVIDRIDRTAPAILGTGDGENSYFGKQISINDGTGTISGIWDNGRKISDSTWISTPGVHKIIVKDDAGNQTELTFTVNPIPFTAKDIKLADKAELDEIRSQFNSSKKDMPSDAAAGYDEQLSKLEERISLLENQVDDFKAAVSELPKADKITTKSESELKKVISIYDSLTKEQKELVSAQKEKLDILKAAMNELKEAEARKKEEESKDKDKTKGTDKSKDTKTAAGEGSKTNTGDKANKDDKPGKGSKTNAGGSPKAGNSSKAGESGKTNENTPGGKSEAGNTSETQTDGKNSSKAGSSSDTGNGNNETGNSSEAENYSEADNTSQSGEKSGEENSYETEGQSASENSTKAGSSSGPDNKSQAGDTTVLKDNSETQDADNKKSSEDKKSENGGEGSEASDSEEKDNQILLNEETQTTVENLDGAFEPDVYLVVEQISEDSQNEVSEKEETEQVSKTIQKAGNAVKSSLNHKELAGLYDISLMKGNTAIQPDGNIKVRIKIPERLKNRKGIDVVHISDDGKVTSMHAAVSEDGIYLEFVTDHFSYYGIVVNQVYQWWWLFIILIIIIVMFIKKKYDDRKKSTYNIGKFIK